MDTFDLHLCPSLSTLLRKAGIHSPAIIDQVVIDSRRIQSKNALFVALPGSRDGHEFIDNAAQAGARYAVVKEGFTSNSSLTLLHSPSPLQTLQEIAAYYRKQLTSTLFVGIAGSYGKTMLKDLLWSILKEKLNIAASPGSFNSQIGVPLSIFTVSKHNPIALIEAAVSEPNEMDSLQRMIVPNCGIITHLGKKHLHTMGDISINVQEILKLFKDVSSWLLVPSSINTNADIIFWNKYRNDLPHVSVNGSLSDPSPPYTVTFPNDSPFHSIITSEQHYFIDLLNMALKAAWLLGARREQIVPILERFVPEPTRTEIWQSSLGTTFINDSTCGDPFSIDNSLQMLKKAAGSGRKIFVFSGLRPGASTTPQDYRRIGQAFARHAIDKLYLVGDYPYHLLLEEIANTQPILCKNLEETIFHLRADARHDDFILLKGSNKLPFNTLASAFADASCSNLCIINLAAIEWNLKTLLKHLPHSTRLMVMIKAHAYGSDSVRMARFLHHSNIDILGVSYVDEAVILRCAGINTALFVINVSPHEACKVVKWNLEAGVSSAASIASLGEESLRQNCKTKVHLHIDTGMSRFGCRPEKALELAQQIISHPGLILEGIMTHFATPDDPQQDTFTLQQIDRFDACIAELKKAGIDPPWKHAANSAAAIRFPLPQYNMARIGLAIWGIGPNTLDLRLALSLISHIEGINLCKKGDTVSYGRHYQVQKEQQAIAVLPIGYFDGLHRNYSGKAQVMIRGHYAPMVGSICMDYMMVDITDIPQARVGDPVLIFGTDQYGQFLSPEGLAHSGNSIAHELITCLGPRIPRVFIHEEAL